MRRSLVLVGFAAAIGGAALSFATIPSAPTQAASTKTTFTVPAQDGYGIGECVSSGSACAKVVADAWCEAQGFSRSASIGIETVEVTASISPATSKAPISVTCAAE